MILKDDEIEFLKTQINDLQTKYSDLEKKINQSSDSDAATLHEIQDMMHKGEWFPRGSFPTPMGWDSLVDTWIDAIPTIGDKIPSAYRIWQTARRYLLAGDAHRADRAERLNYIMHNSYVPARLEFEGEVTFSYGGIGVILHQDSHIEPYVTIGANVTIGGNGASVRTDDRTGQLTTVPRIGTLSTIGANANISGGITLGAFSIVAPNSVVTKSFSPGAIVAGLPAKQIGQITEDNALRYKSKFLPARSWSDEEYLKYFSNAFESSSEGYHRTSSEL